MLEVMTRHWEEHRRRSEDNVIPDTGGRMRVGYV